MPCLIWFLWENPVIERILLIEDTVSARSTLFATLSTISEVSRARSLLEAAAQCGQLNPKVIVADCPIEGEGGADVIAAIREAECDKPLILVSTETSAEAIAEFERQGAFVHLRKPVSEADLLAAVWRAADAEPG